MPSPVATVVILLFWLGVTAHIVDREVLPRFSTNVPTVRIELADEATRSVPGRWGVFRDSTRIGTLYTRMEPVDTDGTFAFKSDYQDMTFNSGGVTLAAKTLNLTTRVRRDGSLAGQGMKANLTVNVLGMKLEGKVTVDAVVLNDVLQGTCTVKSNVIDLDEQLPPRPVPPGPVLHPLQPMNRLHGVQPGQRWTIREINPLGESMAILLPKAIAKFGGPKFNFGVKDPEEFIATVADEPEIIPHKNKPVSCWRIDYRGDRVTAHTWVAVSDGKVLRQQAQSFGEVLRLEREE